ncbi:MAG: DUF4091 domain-containing protein [Thermoguttaceae bacterium]|nr:DUF4091 domain-containing protein [Thermoguttaceae bacterium]
MIEFDCRQGASFLAGVDSAYCELFVPKDVAFGSLNGVLKIFDDNGRRLDLSIDLKVWNFSLPNELSFLPEMNCYSLPENELDYYRLAQLHRTYINRVPYSHRGTVADGLAPTWNMFSRSFDWSAWEKRFGRYFDGSAFADLPRGSVPIEAFYLPLFENFPANIFESFPYPDLWPEESAFSGDYCAVLRDGIKDFARKISREKWDRTKFLFFLNNKMDYKRDGWSRASSPWLLDEPASYRDFAALEFYGEQLKKSLAEISLDNAIQFRADISRPQWERNSLDSSLDVYVVGGGAFRDYRRTVLDRCSSYGRFLYTYGTTVSPEGNCYQPVLWTLDAWSLGADGIVPWQTIGNDNSWRVGDELALFYPAIEESGNCVVPSIRLKAYRRGQQDAEYLNLASKYGKLAREALSANLRKRLRLDETKNEIVSSEDAGTSVYAPVSPDDLISLRRELGEFLNNLDNKELSQ